MFEEGVVLLTLFGGLIRLVLGRDCITAVDRRDLIIVLLLMFN